MYLQYKWVTAMHGVKFELNDKKSLYTINGFKRRRRLYFFVGCQWFYWGRPISTNASLAVIYYSIIF